MSFLLMLAHLWM